MNHLSKKNLGFHEGSVPELLCRVMNLTDHLQLIGQPHFLFTKNAYFADLFRIRTDAPPRCTMSAYEFQKTVLYSK